MSNCAMYARSFSKAFLINTAATFSLFLSSLSHSQDIPQTPTDWLRLSADTLCKAENNDALSLQQFLPGAWFLSETASPPGRPFLRRAYRYALPGGELHVSFSEVNGALRRFSADYFATDAQGNLKPLMQAQSDGTCTVRSARRIKQEGEYRLLEQLDADLETLLWEETLEAPWPRGAEPSGPRIALIDSGLAYDLPTFKDRLARDETGNPLGYDFWDLDPLPYDGDTSRNAFQPIRHGTPVASIITQEAPEAALIPYRYPRPDMSRIGDVIRRISASGARIISMPLGSRRPEDWVTFEKAMQEHPELLAIVSAGNNGQNVDDTPLWPGTLALNNMIVVTSSDDFGRLAPGSNWGPETVDLMVPAENRQVIDFRGARGRASGTSYAVPRIAALAARLLAADPSMTTDDLKAAIFARSARPRDDGIVAVGWIIDPDRD